MDTHMIVEMIGYFSSLLVLVSFLMTSVIRLRIVNSIGAIIFTVYATIIGSYPTALMNLCLVGINMYNLYKLLKSPKRYEVITEEPEAAGLQYFLNHYAEDIKHFFPDFGFAKSGADAAYMVVHDTVPAGVLLGKKRADGNLEILLDYTTPQYRDCSVGRYLYGALGGQGIEKLTFPNAPEGHVDYLEKVGFVKTGGAYERKI